MKRYAGTLYYHGEKISNKKEVEFDESQFSPELPEAHEEAVRHEED